MNAAFENNFADKLASKQFLLSKLTTAVVSGVLMQIRFFSMITFEP